MNLACTLLDYVGVTFRLVVDTLNSSVSRPSKSTVYIDRSHVYKCVYLINDILNHYPEYTGFSL